MEQHVQGFENGELEFFVCECGNDKFTVNNAVYDERGVVEHDFNCK